MNNCYITGIMIGTGFWLLIMWVLWKISSSDYSYDPHGESEE